MAEDGFLTEILHRRLRPEDAGEVLTLQLAAFVAEGRLYGTTEIPPLVETLDEVRRELEQTISIGADLSGRLVGSVRLTLEGAIGWISRVAVAPDQQGKGIGSGLLQAIETAAPLQVDRFQLAVAARSDVPIAMYERRGYRQLSRRIGGGGVELVIMAKGRR